MITIYCHIHVASGRRYVGQTRLSMERRWWQHVYDAIRGFSGSRAFAAAICEYGPNAFAHEVLETCETQAAGNEAETKWIGHYDSLVPGGFNLKFGASGGKGDVHPETCARISVAKTGWWSGLSVEQRSAIAHGARSTRESRMTQEDYEIERERGRVAAKRNLAPRTPEQKAHQQWLSRQAVAAMSPEQKAEISRHARDRWTPELRAEWAARAEAQHASEDPGVRAERYARAGDAMCDWHASHTPEEQLELADKIRAGHMRRSSADRLARARKASDAARARSPEERSASARRSVMTRRVRAVESFVAKLDAMPESDRLAILSFIPALA
jgi:hypothetical protein